MAEHHGNGFEAPGSFVLIMTWFTVFVLVYFLNWKYLTDIWPIN
jgi:cytochrome c oxidase subunit 1